MLRLFLLVASVAQLLVFRANAQQNAPVNSAPLAPNAPADRPVSVAVADDSEAEAALAAFEQHIAPAIKKARATLPQAKKRFLQGLPSGQAFYVTTRISDPNGPYEQVFVRVKQWQGTQVQGFIASQLDVVKTYQQNQLITFSASDVFDWTISRPDGSEEGNFVGKLIDAGNQ
ncbi:DUF2314 domain-containing protein [Hymenobacter caeli]|uniref:Uncharacterized protein YegJ (DUF2314 family) n=1 Tax=Hymenobacter caeli TaxID=2735894 RepID=A0ABX2FN55_9BACT|nr:DUF2314 domain-containing protein [Hymenobacter caeli]NRT18593.1 uncharacterized protein YegJ (DUF2314 family) [Hymenobacter caeli]